MSSLSPLVDAIKKMSATELHLVPGERIYVIRKGKRRDIGRDPVKPASVDKLVAEVIGESGLAAAHARPQSRRTESDGLVFDMIATAGINGISACLRVVPMSHAFNEIDLEMPEAPPSAAPTSTGSFARVSAPPVLTLDAPIDFEPSVATTPPAAGPSAAPSSLLVSPSMVPTSLNEILETMVAMHASDLHLTTGASPAVRVDGDLVFLADRPPLSNDDIRSFARGLADGRAVRDVDDRRDTVFVHTGADGTLLRVAVFADHAGTSAVVRQLTPAIAPLEGYGLPEQVLEACRLLRGLVLVAGGRSSGKSTLLASMTDYANRMRAGHLLSIEDPIEIVHASQRSLVRQRQVGEHTPSIAEGVRAAKREDADVIVVSELADRDAIRAAIEAADAGRLVIGGSPSTTAAGALERLVASCAPDAQHEIRHVLATLPTTVVGQVLCRRAGGGLVPAIEIVLDGATVTSFADSLVALVRHRMVAPEEAWLRAPDRDQIATAFHGAGIPFPS